MVSAAPFRDRVVQHALCAVVEPIFERGFIHDSYANRKGKGTHRAVARYERFRDRFRHVLRCDVYRYFPAIDHDLLKRDLRRRIACARTLALADRIIDTSNPQEPVRLYYPGAAECSECLVFDTASRQELAAELESVLARIRERRPDVADIRARVAFRPRTLLIEAEPTLLAALAQAPEGKTGHAAVDALNEALDLERVHIFYGATSEAASRSVADLPSNGSPGSGCAHRSACLPFLGNGFSNLPGGEG